MAGLSLSKGANLSLTKTSPGLTVATIGLGWDPRTTAGQQFDLDASAILVGADGRIRSSDDFIFYNQMSTPDQSVVHLGDNRTGEGDGDDEQIVINLPTVAPDVQRIVIAVSIYDADNRRQNFGQVRAAFCRVMDQDYEEIVRYDLTEDAAQETAMLFAEIYRYNGEWKFKAVGQGYTEGLGGIARDFGVPLD